MQSVIYLQTHLLAFHTSRLRISDVFHSLSADRLNYAAVDTWTEGENPRNSRPTLLALMNRALDELLLSRNAMHKRGMCYPMLSYGVCPAGCLSRVLCQNE